MEFWFSFALLLGAASLAAALVPDGYGNNPEGFGSACQGLDTCKKLQADLRCFCKLIGGSHKSDECECRFRSETNDAAILKESSKHLTIKDGD